MVQFDNMSTMTCPLPPPPPFAIHDVGAPELWKEWRARFKAYATATKLNKEEPDVQVSTLLTIIGAEAHRVFLTFQWEREEDQRSLESVIQRFGEYVQPKVNIAVERFKFNSRNQGVGEPFDQYVTVLRQMAARCAHDKISPDELLRDRIVFGIADGKVRERLLREENLDLNKTLTVCRASELSAAQIKEIGKLGDLSVNAVESKGRHIAAEIPNCQPKALMIRDCNFCGRDHERSKTACPAWGKQCTLCKRMNHFKVKCARTRSGIRSLATEHADHCESEGKRLSDERLQIFTIRQVAQINLSDEQTITLKVRDSHYIRFQIDSGADCNVLPVHVYKAATGDETLSKVKPSNVRLMSFGQRQEKSVGHANLKVGREKSVRGKLISDVCVIKCELVEGTNFHAILGSAACRGLGLLEIKDSDAINPIDHNKNVHVHAASGMAAEQTSEESIKRQYPQVFSDRVGYLGDCSIRINRSVAPVQHAPRRVPVALRNRLHEELVHLQEQGIICAVTEPTEWVSSMVVVPKKNGKLRVCLDPKDLNRAVMREHYPLPTIEEVSSKLAGAEIFTLLDVKHGFWHIKLDEQSSFLTTFNTPFGRFRWSRLPFGISIASEIFQRKMHELIEGLQGVEVIADDFLVYGKNEKAHDMHLHAFLRRCEERNVVLSDEKLKLKSSEVPFIGHMATPEGLMAAPEKISAVMNMPQPTDVASVRRFLGMVQYLAKFLPQLSDMTQPLRVLTQKDIDFSWGTAQERAFKAVKLAVTKTPVLRYYSLDEEVTVQCDASKDGLGAALLQNGQPVAYASRSLTDCESRYAQIEKECLAIVFACERFDFYWFGRSRSRQITCHWNPFSKGHWTQPQPAFRK